MKKFRVHMIDKETNEKLILIVQAASVDEATRSLSTPLFGLNGRYRWTGSEPSYE